MDGKPAKRNRALTAEEAELWAYTMRDAHSLRRRSRAQKPAPQPDEVELSLALPAAATAEAKGKNLASPRSAAAAVKTPPAPPPAFKPPTLANYDEKERRRLSRNPELIDARLDLHGMRQREAHSALRSFILSASARGCRHLLVITGKGTSAERERDFLREERGVLKRLVPQWLGEAELRNFVVSYTASHTRHGGEGALYVRLRKSGGR
jgi:DNA-nicking Smr family endonuclease